MYVHIGYSWMELPLFCFMCEKKKKTFSCVYVLPNTFAKFCANLHTSENWSNGKKHKRKSFLFSVILGAPPVVTTFSIVQGSPSSFMVSHTHTQKHIFPCSVCKLLRLVSSLTTSKESVKPQMMINNQTVLLVSLLHLLLNKSFWMLLFCFWVK